MKYEGERVWIFIDTSAMEKFFDSHRREYENVIYNLLVEDLLISEYFPMCSFCCETSAYDKCMDVWSYTGFEEQDIEAFSKYYTEKLFREMSAEEFIQQHSDIPGKKYIFSTLHVSVPTQYKEHFEIVNPRHIDWEEFKMRLAA